MTARGLYPGWQLVGHGNSITGNSYATSWTTQIAGMIGIKSIQNHGVNAATTSDLIAGFDPTWVSGNRCTVAVLWEVSNAIYLETASSAQEALDQVVTWANLYRGANHRMKVIVPTVIARGNFPSQTAMNAMRLQFNSLLLASSSLFDAVYDAAALFTDYNDATLYNADTCHLTNAGQLRFATGLAPMVNSIAP